MYSIIAKQMLIMGIFMTLGAVLFKKELISKEGSISLTNILIYAINPALIFRSFCKEYTPETLKSLGISFLLGAIIQGFGILISHFVFRKKPMNEVAASYANTGFFGIPVVQASLGSSAVFYIAPLVVITGTLMHSYGVARLKGGKEKIDWKRFFFAPNTISFLCGLVAFILGIGTKIPATLSKCIDLVADMSAFFAMTILGIFFIQSDLKQLYKNIEIYIVAIVRLIVIPVLCALLFRFIPADYTMKLAILLAFAGPVGLNLANYALLFNRDYGTASLHVSISTILCLITLPFYAYLAELILS